MGVTIAVGALLSGIAALVAVKVGGVMLGLVVFFALFLLLSGGSLAFLSALSIPTVFLIFLIILFIWWLSKKK